MSEGISEISGKCEPTHVLDDRIKLVAMNNQEASRIRGPMERVFLNADVTVASEKLREKFIMVPGDDDHPGALPGFAQNFLQDVVVRLWPKHSPPHCPPIDEIADDVERLALVLTQKVQ